MSRAQLTSTVEQNTGGAVAPFLAGKNKIINGDFGIWARGTSFNPSAGGYFYTADRWQTYNYGTSATTVSQQAFTAGSAPVSGYESAYFLRITSTNTKAFLVQWIEGVRAFANQTITISFWAKSASAQSLTLIIDQNFGTGGSPSATVSTTAGTPSVTTSWARYSATIAVPSISGKTIGTNNDDKLGIHFEGAINNALDIWGVQVEAGPVATPFTTASNTLQGELALCQRYYYRLPNAFNNPLCAAYFYTASEIDTYIQFPVPMRTIPTVDTTTGSGYYRVYWNGNTNVFNGFGINQASNFGVFVLNNALGFTGNAGMSGIVLIASTSAYLGFQAEL